MFNASHFSRSRLIVPLVSILLTLVVVGCGASATPGTNTNGQATSVVPTKIPVAPTSNSINTPVSANTNSPSWLKVYFTDPANTNEADQDLTHYIVGNVLPVIAASKKSIDITSFDFNLPGFVDAVITAKKRGVAVRVVVDDKNGTQILKASDKGPAFDAVKTLTAAGITVVGGGRSNGLMHNKIIIVDGMTLFMGSWNMSYNDTFRNNNNLLAITSSKLIANYQAKFNELYVDKKFGTKAVVGSLTPSLTLDSIQVENYFSPVDNVMDKLVAQVTAAKKSIRFMAFTYTDKRLSAAMISRANAGVTVQGVIENRGASQGAFVPLACAKLPVETDGNKYTMHHKVIILDDSTVITGSFNFTATADNANDDNVLIIHSPAVAKLYLQEFDKVYKLGKAPDLSTLNCSAPAANPTDDPSQG